MATDEVTPADFARAAKRSAPFLLWWSVGMAAWGCVIVLAVLQIAGVEIANEALAIAYGVGLALLGWRRWHNDGGIAPFVLLGIPLAAPCYLLMTQQRPELHGAHAALIAVFAVWVWQWGGWLRIFLRRNARGG